MLRRYGAPPRPEIDYVDRPGAYAIILVRGGVLLTWQGAPYHEFQLPGGGIDPGETPVAALHREVREETGWKIDPIRRLGTYRTYKWMPEYRMHARKVCHIFLARGVARKGPPTEDGHVAVVMPAQVAARSVSTSGDRAFLRALLAAR